MRTVVLGGYGNFGARICRALRNDANIELVVAGRDGARAEMLAAELDCGASHARIDATQADLAHRLRELGAELVIHTAGPFQQQDYVVPLAVAAAGAHYIDLADGRRFVCDFRQAADTAFRNCGRIAISGASTVPALSSAVIEHLAANWQRIGAVDVCIAPAQTAPRGIATMTAVLHYCGAPIQVWRNGGWTTCHGWSTPESVTFKRLRPRIGALCDIPDLELFPERYPGIQDVMFRAALEIGVTQRALSLMALLRRAGVIRRPERFAEFFNNTAKLMDRFGSALGGMVVRVRGVDQEGKEIRRAWHIAADDDHGPEIPCMAAILLARRIAGTGIGAAGAHPCMGWLTLADFESEFAKWNMVTDCMEEKAAHAA